MIALAAAALLAAPAVAGRSEVFFEDFSSIDRGKCFGERKAFGAWRVDFAGFGCVRVEGSGDLAWLSASTAASRRPSETHAVFVSGPVVRAPLTYEAKVESFRQLRKGSRANPWEVGWLVWDYADNAHFYYFVPRRDGWELGKRDPAYAPSGQRTLASGASPRFHLRKWHSIRIVQDDARRIEIFVNEQRIAEFTDDERPYVEGRIGFYCEDSEARLRDVSLSGAIEEAPPTRAASDWFHAQPLGYQKRGN